MYINIQSLSWHSELEVEDESKKQGLEIDKGLPDHEKQNSLSYYCCFPTRVKPPPKTQVSSRSLGPADCETSQGQEKDECRNLQRHP